MQDRQKGLEEIGVVIIAFDCCIRYNIYNVTQ